MASAGNSQAAKSFVCVALVATPTIAYANFFWPPTLYYLGVQTWWAIPLGLAAEVLVLRPFTRMKWLILLQMLCVANLVSALVGLVALWPVVFWMNGVDAVIRFFGFAAIPVIALLVFSLNVYIEQKVCAIGWKLQTGGVRLLGIAIGNALSLTILVAAGMQNLRV